ncbi:MAG: hypothetical protein ACREIV_13140, partial [Planctomycetaceae bacterium]
MTRYLTIAALTFGCLCPIAASGFDEDPATESASAAREDYDTALARARQAYLEQRIAAREQYLAALAKAKVAAVEA